MGVAPALGTVVAVPAGPRVPGVPVGEVGKVVAAPSRRVALGLFKARRAEDTRHGPFQVVVLVAVVEGGDRRPYTGRGLAVRPFRVAKAEGIPATARPLRRPEAVAASARPAQLAALFPVVPSRPSDRRRVGLPPSLRATVQAIGQVRRRAHIRSRRLGRHGVGSHNALVPARRRTVRRPLVETTVPTRTDVVTVPVVGTERLGEVPVAASGPPQVHRRPP